MEPMNETKLASMKSRLGAYIIDCISYCVIIFFTALFLWYFFPSTIYYLETFSVFYTSAIIFLYYFLFFKFGGTIGMLILKIDVVNIDGSKMNTFKCALRTVGIMINEVIRLGHFLWVFNKDKKNLQDYLAGTIVIERRYKNVYKIRVQKVK